MHCISTVGGSATFAIEKDSTSPTMDMVPARGRSACMVPRAGSSKGAVNSGGPAWMCPTTLTPGLTSRRARYTAKLLAAVTTSGPRGFIQASLLCRTMRMRMRMTMTMTMAMRMRMRMRMRMTMAMTMTMTMTMTIRMRMRMHRHHQGQAGKGTKQEPIKVHNISMNGIGYVKKT